MDVLVRSSQSAVMSEHIGEASAENRLLNLIRNFV